MSMTIDMHEKATPAPEMTTLNWWKLQVPTTASVLVSYRDPVGHVWLELPLLCPFRNPILAMELMNPYLTLRGVSFWILMYALAGENRSVDNYVFRAPFTFRQVVDIQRLE